MTAPAEADAPVIPSIHIAFTVYHTGGRLQITADVDAEGVAKLKEILTKYEEILTLENSSQ